MPKHLWLIIGLLVLSMSAVAAPTTISYQGRITRADGTPVTGPVDFRIQILSPNAANCLMFEEERTVTITSPQGAFSININDGGGLRRDPGLYQFEELFSNRTFTYPSGCTTPGTFTLDPNANRKLVVSFDAGSGWETLPTMDTAFAPQAIESMRIAGYGSGDLLRVDKLSSQTVNALTYTDYEKLVDLLAGKLNRNTLPTMTSGQVLGSNGSGGWTAVTPLTSADVPNCASGSFLRGVSGALQCDPVPTGGGGSGSVTSVGVTVPTFMSSTGGPITTAGDIALGFNSQAANLVFAGPTTGSSAPAFRTLGIMDIKSTNTGNFFAASGGCPAGQTLTYSSVNDQITCEAYSLTASQVTTALTYTPVNRAGDTMTGALNLPSNGLAVGTNQLVVSGAQVGIGTTTPTATLEVAGQIKITGGAPGANKVLTSDASGNATWQDPAAAGLSGTGTANTVPYYNTTSTLASSPISISSSFVGIGTASPSASLHVNGIGLFGNYNHGLGDLRVGRNDAGAMFSIQSTGAVNRSATMHLSGTDSSNNAMSLEIRNNAATSTLQVLSSSAHDLQLGTNSTGNLTIQNGGNVGVGTNNPTARLEVAGQIKITGGSPGTNKVLTSNAAGLATWETPAAGGSSLTNFTEAVNTAAPNATVPVVSLTATNAATEVDVALQPKGGGAILANIPDGADTGGNKRGSFAIDLQTYRDLNTQVASGVWSVVGGGAYNTAAGLYSVVPGGHANAANGNSSLAAGSGSTADAFVQTTFGSNNLAKGSENATTWVATDPLFVVGNGTAPGSRSTALMILKNGSVGIGTTAPTTKLEVTGQVKITGGAPGAGKVLTSDAAGLATWVTPAAGGLTNFTEAVNTATPNATVPAVSLTATNAAANVDLVLRAKGAGAIIAGIPDDASTGGNKRGQYAVDLQSSRVAGSFVASGYQSVISGGGSNLASGTSSSVGGGSLNSTPGSYSAIPGGNSNMASGSTSFVAGGEANTASGLYSFASGFSTTASARSQATFGTWNLPKGSESATNWVTTDPLFVIGNGTGSGASRSTAFMVLKDGSVGIGTTSPTTKLEVTGQVKITGGAPGAGKVLTSDASGLATWETPAAGGLTGTVNTVPYYNTTSTLATSPITITSSNVGIGTTNPGAGTALSVNGQISSKSASTTGAYMDFTQGNVIVTSFDCGTSLTLEDIRDGGSYTVIVTGVGTTQCSFNTSTAGDDAATVNYRFSPANGTRTASSHTVYSLMRAGNTVYVSWITGF